MSSRNPAERKQLRRFLKCAAEQIVLAGTQGKKREFMTLGRKGQATQEDKNIMKFYRVRKFEGPKPR